jgi:hypothetical protein
MSERRCLGPDDMRAEGLSQDARGYWRREYGVIAA